jgi:hypothetical protein
MMSFAKFLAAKNERSVMNEKHGEVHAYVAVSAPLGVTTAAVSDRFFGGDRRQAKIHLDVLKENGRIRKCKYVWEAV